MESGSNPQDRFDVTGESQNIFKEANEFSQFIEQKAFVDNTTVLEVLLEFIDNNDVEPEQLKPFISQSLKNKLEQNFIDRGLIRAPETLQNFFGL